MSIIPVDLPDETPLRVIAPELYLRLIQVLEEHHIHSYDVEATAVIKGDGLEMFLRFGDDYAQTIKFQIDKVEMKEPGEETIRFFHQIAEQSKKQLISDYFKMMKP